MFDKYGILFSFFKTIVQDTSQLPLDQLTAQAFLAATQQTRIAHGLLRFLTTRSSLSCLHCLMFTRVQILKAVTMIMWKLEMGLQIHPLLLVKNTATKRDQC